LRLTFEQAEAARERRTAGRNVVQRKTRVVGYDQGYAKERSEGTTGTTLQGTDKKQQVVDHAQRYAREKSDGTKGTQFSMV